MTRIDRPATPQPPIHLLAAVRPGLVSGTAGVSRAPAAPAAAAAAFVQQAANPFAAQQGAARDQPPPRLEKAAAARVQSQELAGFRELASRQPAAQAQRASGPKPIAEGGKDTAYDGAFVGADGKAYPASTPLSQVPSLKPDNGKTPAMTVIYVNGANTDKASQTRDMQNLANTAGAEVVGIHNSTEGVVADVVQSAKDKLNLGTNPAVQTLAATLLDKVRKGEPVHIMGHSQGGLVASNALRQVQETLRAEGRSAAQVEQMLSKVRVETFAAAAHRYPDGPQYVHYVNRLDPVSLTSGQLNLGIFDKTGEMGGKGAVVHRFSDWNAGKPHRFSLFMENRMPFETARSTPPKLNDVEKFAATVRAGLDANRDGRVDLKDVSSAGSKAADAMKAAGASLGIAVKSSAGTVQKAASKAAGAVSSFVKSFKFW